MDRSNFGSTAEIIGRITDPNQLQAMLKNPQYAGFTSVIIARLTEINRMRQSAQGAAPAAPTVAQQAVAGQAPPPGMAKGGIVAFKAGGKVKKLDDYKYKNEEYKAAVPRDVPIDMPVTPPVAGPSMQDFMQQQGIDAASAPAAAPAGIRGFADGGYVPAAPAGMDIHPARKGLLHSLHDTLYPDYATPLTPEEMGVVQSQSAPVAPTAAAAPSTSQPAAQSQLLTPEAFYGGPESGGAWSMRAGNAYAPKLAVPDVRSPASYAQEYQQQMGPNTDLDTARAQMAALTQGRQQQQANSLNMAMIRAGLGMANAASTTPRAGILGNLATGVTQGLDQYTAEREALNKEQAEELQRQVQLGQISRQEAADRLRYATLQSRTDEQTAKAIQLENAKAQMEAQRINAMGAMYKPMAQQQAEARFYGQRNYLQALNDYNNALKAGQTPPAPPGHVEDYIGDAMQKITQGGIAAGIRAQTAQDAMVNNRYMMLQKANPDKDPAYLWQMAQQDGTMMPSATHRGPLQ